MRVDQLADDIAPPRPLADRRQAALVDVDDHDAAARRPGRRARSEPVVGAVLEAGEERAGGTATAAAVSDRRHQAADEHETTRPQRHRTVISTRRLRGSSTSSAVLTSRSASPCERHLDHARHATPASIEKRADRVGALAARARSSPPTRPVVSVCPTTATSGNGLLLDGVQHLAAAARGSRRSVRPTRTGSTA